MRLVLIILLIGGGELLALGIFKSTLAAGLLSDAALAVLVWLLVNRARV